MTKADQRMIVTEILDTLRAKIMENIDRVPSSWDGIELRAWVSDTTREQFALCRLDRKRKRAYDNTRLTENL